MNYMSTVFEGSECSKMVAIGMAENSKLQSHSHRGLNTRGPGSAWDPREISVYEGMLVVGGGDAGALCGL